MRGDCDDTEMKAAIRIAAFLVLWLAGANQMAAAAAAAYAGEEAHPIDMDSSDAPDPAPSRRAQVGSKPASYENSLGMKMIRVDAGQFVMGSDDGDWDEAPPQTVRISRPFFIGATEVTNAQYEQFDPEHRRLRGKLGFSNRDDEAVVYVSWHDAVRFCRWLSQRETVVYRLPTEAEWEYACRAGTTTAYHTGDRLPGAFRKNALADSWTGGWYPSPRWSPNTWYASRDESREKGVVPLTVARTDPNPWGLYDMHGNVEEWCGDWYGPYPSAPRVDPAGDVSGDFRVARGGSHSSELEYLRSANRMGTLPDDRHWLIGFRVVQGEAVETLRDVDPRRADRDRAARSDAELSRRPSPRSAAEPYFEGPRRFVKIPAGSEGPLFSRHNHSPAIVDCPNGDLLAIWYTCRNEPGRELAIAASRLRAGRTEWDDAQPFWDAPDRNDHTLRLWRDERGTLYHFNGLSAAATWGNLAVVRRTSADSGKTWSRAQLVMPEHERGVGSVVRLRSGRLVMVGGSADSRGDAAHLLSSDNGGLTWSSLQPEVAPWPEITEGGRGPWIAGSHVALVELGDGRLFALARGNNIDGRMPQSTSADGGRTWTWRSSPFDPIAGRQRPVLLRLREGPIFFASFATSLRATDTRGNEIDYTGLFAALSYDEGQTWRIRRPITIEGLPREVEGIGKRSPVTIGPGQGEPTGYLSVCQAADGVIHLITSRHHYAFNLAWLERAMRNESGAYSAGKRGMFMHDYPTGVAYAGIFASVW